MEGAEMNGCREYETLICGDITIENMYDYHEIMKNLSDKIKKLTYLIMNYNWENGNANVDIPFYCRNVLESSLTAILGRISTIFPGNQEVEYRSNCSLTHRRNFDIP